MKKLVSVLSVAAFALGAAQTNAAEVKVDWHEPGKYRDVKEANGSDSRFKKRVFKEFEEHFTELAADLPADQTLSLKVTNVDLAGDIRFRGAQEYRLVKDLYIPRMSFSYQLTDKQGQSIKQDKVEVKDMSFLSRSMPKHKRGLINYEKRMLTEWFEETFK